MKVKKESLKIQAIKKELPRLQEDALDLWRKDQASAKELGRALVAVRDAMEATHGKFAGWFRKKGLDENRVYYCMRVAEGKKAEGKGSKKAQAAPIADAVREFKRCVNEGDLEMIAGSVADMLMDGVLHQITSSPRWKAEPRFNKDEHRERLYRQVKEILALAVVARESQPAPKAADRPKQQKVA